MLDQIKQSVPVFFDVICPTSLFTAQYTNESAKCVAANVEIKPFSYHPSKNCNQSSAEGKNVHRDRLPSLSKQVIVKNLICQFPVDNTDLIPCGFKVPL